MRLSLPVLVVESLFGNFIESPRFLFRR